MSHLFFETEDELDSASNGLRGKNITAGEAGPHKRRFGRRTMRGEFRLRDEQGWGPMTLRCIDISPTGVFLASDLLFEEGEGFILEFVSPVTQRTVRVWSRVVRVAQDGNQSALGHTGMAFEFVDLTNEQREELTSYIAPNVNVTAKYGQALVGSAACH